MAITASGLYGLTLEKMFIDTAAESLEAEDNKGLLELDAYTHDYNAHDFRNDVTANEASGTGYTAGGNAITTTEVTISGGVLTFDAADASWPSSTIANAMAEIGYFVVGADTTDMLIFLSDFVTAASSSGGTFTIQRSASGIFTVDFTP